MSSGQAIALELTPAAPGVSSFPVAVTPRVDALMQHLCRIAYGELHQTLIAECSVADAYRSALEEAPRPDWRPSLAIMNGLWRGLGLFARPARMRLSAQLCTLAGLFKLFGDCLRLHADGYICDGPADAPVVLLRTVTANEPLIARWASEHLGRSVRLLQRNEAAERQVSALRHIPWLVITYVRLVWRTAQILASIARDAMVAPADFDRLAPYWMVLLCRRAADIAWAHCWARLHLGRQEVSHLFITMNTALDNAFRLALPRAACAYVEHGFPRRDIPPLPCTQYVYSEGYAAYLRSFDPGLDVHVIGLGYFPHGHIAATRAIVVASLQDWPQFKVADVADIFNRALDAARQHGWRLVFRTRAYDADAFVKALNGPWDEVSEAADESFAACLDRTRPAMVWTTWSTAVLDAKAQEIDAVAFVTPKLDDFFISDLAAFAHTVMPDGTGFDRVIEKLEGAPKNSSRWRPVKHVLVPRLVDEDQRNAQNLNAKAMLARFDAPNITWHAFNYGPPDPAVARNPRVVLHRLARWRFWPWHILAHYVRAYDAVFYPGNDWFDVYGVWYRQRARVSGPIVATLEGLQGDHQREQFLSQLAGHPVFCYRSGRTSPRADLIRQRASLIIAISPFLARMSRALFAPPATHIPLGVDLSLFSPGPARSSERAISVVTAGTVLGRKNPHMFLEAADRFPAAHFTWYGDGPERAEILSEVRSRGLTNVAFPGEASQADLARAMKNADVAVIPSQCEGVPKVSQEAVASGIPVILFGNYEAPTVVDGQNGFVVWSEAEFLERLGTLLRDPDLATRMGAVGAEMARSWHWDLAARQWMEAVRDELCHAR